MSPTARDESGQEVPADEAGQQDQQYSAVQEGSGPDGGQPAQLPSYGQTAAGEQPPATGSSRPPTASSHRPRAAATGLRAAAATAYGQQPPAYGQQPPAYGEQPWGGVPQAQPWDNSAYGTAAAGALPKEAYASWGQRVGAYLIDYGVFIVGLHHRGHHSRHRACQFVDLARSGDRQPRPSSIRSPSSVTCCSSSSGSRQLAFTIWNRWIRAGRTGMSIGKERMGIKLVGVESGAPIGGGKAFLRDLVRGLLGYVPLVPLIDLLFPLWDDKRQTLTDKILSTVVVKNQ